MRDQHGAHAHRSRAGDVVVWTVADEHTVRVSDTDGCHGAAERFRVRLGMGDLRRVDGAVDKVEDLIANEHVLVPLTVARSCWTALRLPASKLAEQFGHIGIDIDSRRSTSPSRPPRPRSSRLTSWPVGVTTIASIPGPSTRRRISAGRARAGRARRPARRGRSTPRAGPSGSGRRNDIGQHPDDEQHRGEHSRLRVVTQRRSTVRAVARPSRRFGTGAARRTYPRPRPCAAAAAPELAPQRRDVHLHEVRVVVGVAPDPAEDLALAHDAAALRGE